MHIQTHVNTLLFGVFIIIAPYLWVLDSQSYKTKQLHSMDIAFPKFYGSEGLDMSLSIVLLLLCIIMNLWGNECFDLI